MIKAAIVTLLVSAGAISTAVAQTAPPHPGRTVARDLCGECHQTDDASPRSFSGPSFLAVSRMPSTTTLSIKVFLQSSHRNMPNLILTPTEIDDVADYIVSLAPK